MASPAFVLAFSIAGCATTAPPRERPPAQATAPGREAWSESDLPETDAEAPRRPRAGDDLAPFDLQARLAVRARSYLGRRGPFQAKGERFGGDCSGFVEAVYAAEGLMLRGLMQRAAPGERSGVAAAWHAVKAHGRVFGAREWPAPGDLVFWHDTYDRNRNGRADDRFTHLGMVEYVEDGTVTFLHRGGRGVARGVMTPGRPGEASDPDGRRLNSPIRATTHPVKDGSGLAGALLAGYGRLDPARVPPEFASARIDPFFGERADRDAPEGPARVEATPTSTTGSDAPSTPPATASTASTAAKASSRTASATKPSPKNASGSKKASKRSVAKARAPKPKKTSGRGAAR